MQNSSNCAYSVSAVVKWITWRNIFKSMVYITLMLIIWTAFLHISVCSLNIDKIHLDLWVTGFFPSFWSVSSYPFYMIGNL